MSRCGYVVVTGAPASGKSTLARMLADRLDLPLLAKDEIKQVLVDRLGTSDVAASRRLGAASVDVLLHVARAVGCGVIDSVWVDPVTARAALAALPAPVVEVNCRAPVELLRTRYRARAATRPVGHFDSERPDSELWNATSLQPLGGTWPVLEVDTTSEVDVEQVVGRLRASGAGDGERGR